MTAEKPSADNGEGVFRPQLAATVPGGSPPPAGTAWPELYLRRNPEVMKVMQSSRIFTRAVRMTA